MQLNPRYDDSPAIDLRLAPEAIRQPFLTQRRRLVELVGSLTDDQLAAPSRCDEWSVSGVLAHLADVDRFWGASAAGGLAGTPTRFLADFDPEATPKALVAGWADVPPAELRSRFAAATTQLCDAVEAFDDGWERAVAEAPPGHVPLPTMLAHAVWDAWIHERDIAIPLGLDPVEDAAEVTAVLAYAASLSPAFAANAEPTRTGGLAVVATDADVTLVVDIADGTATVTMGEVPDDGRPIVEGRAAALADGLSERGPFDHGLAPEHAWMLEGLAAVFTPTS